MHDAPRPRRRRSAHRRALALRALDILGPDAKRLGIVQRMRDDADDEESSSSDEPDWEDFREDR